MKQLWKAVNTAALVAGAIGAAASPASAQITFAGNTFGCFYSGATAPVDCTGLMSQVGNLTYNGSTFSVTSNTADGLLSIGRSPASPNVNNLGSFNLHDGNYNYTGQEFALFVNFTQPAGVAGNNLYTAMITGNLTNATSGNVFVSFASTAHTFTFADGTTLSDFVVDPISINDDANSTAGATIGVSGHGYATVPEPSSLALLGTGLVGIVPLFRKRRNV